MEPSNRFSSDPDSRNRVSDFRNRLSESRIRFQRPVPRIQEPILGNGYSISGHGSSHFHSFEIYPYYQPCKQKKQFRDFGIRFLEFEILREGAEVAIYSCPKACFEICRSSHIVTFKFNLRLSLNRGLRCCIIILPLISRFMNKKVGIL